MMHLLARMPPALVAVLCALWIIGGIAVPILYLRLRGWGSYWVFSLEEVLPSLLLLFGPPAFLAILWHRARRGSDGRGAV
jgi:hypothetical protein